MLTDYPADIARLAGDPRTGVISAFPMGLPNVGQVKQFLDEKLARRDHLARLSALPKVENRPALPRPPAGPGAWANVLVRKELPLYAKMKERAEAEGADPREFLFTEEGIKVSLAWIEGGPSKKQQGPRMLSDDDLRAIYSKSEDAA